MEPRSRPGLALPGMVPGLIARPSWLLMVPLGSSWLILASPGSSWIFLAPPDSSWILIVMAPPGSLPLSLSWLWLPLVPPGPSGVFADFVMLSDIQLAKCSGHRLHNAKTPPGSTGSSWLVHRGSSLLLAPPGCSWFLLASPGYWPEASGSSWLILAPAVWES